MGWYTTAKYRLSLTFNRFYRHTHTQMCVVPHKHACPAPPSPGHVSLSSITTNSTNGLMYLSFTSWWRFVTQRIEKHWHWKHASQLYMGRSGFLVSVLFGNTLHIFIASRCCFKTKEWRKGNNSCMHLLIRAIGLIVLFWSRASHNNSSPPDLERTILNPNVRDCLRVKNG